MLQQLIRPSDYLSFMRAATYLGLLGAAAGLVTSPAILSIATLLIILPAMLSMHPLEQMKRFLANKTLFFFALIYPVHLLSWFWSDDQGQFLEDLRIKAPLFFIPYALSVLGPYTPRQTGFFLAVFSGAVFIVGTGTVINYFAHYEEMNHLISIAKPVHTFLGLNHIYFSICLFAGVFGSAWLCLGVKEPLFKNSRLIFGILSVLMAAYLHIITTRTGLVAFYGAILASAVLYVLRSRKYLAGLAALLLIVSVPVMAYYTVPSLRNRFENTWTDLEAVYYDIDPNDYSLATRVEAWKTAVNIFKRAPLQGVGTADLRAEMTAQYRMDDSELEERNQEMPHNQFLELLAGLGLLGFIPFIIGWMSPVFTPGRLRGDWLLPTLWTGLTLAMMVESVLERQVGVALVSILLALLCVKEKR